MIDLNSDAGSMLMHRLSQHEQTGQIIIMINTQLCRSV